MHWTVHRRLVQILALIGANLYLGFIKTKQVYQGSLKSTCVPFLNCHSCPSAFMTCPIGGLQHFMTIHKIPLTLVGYLAAVGIAVGSMPCGWLCPFGLLQDLMYKIKSVKIQIPSELAILRYFVLFFLVLLIPLWTQETWFSKLCPMGTLQAALPWAVWNPSIPVYGEPAVSTSVLGTLFTIKILILVLFLVLFVAAKRPFCRFVCPLGAVFGCFNKYSLLRLKVDTKSCGTCTQCVSACPVDLNIGHSPNASTCVRCLECLKCDNVQLLVFGLEESGRSQAEKSAGVFQKIRSSRTNQYGSIRNIVLYGLLPTLIVVWGILYIHSRTNNAPGQHNPAWLGIETAEIDSAMARQYAVHAMRGLLVTRTFVGSPAVGAGLKNGDIIRRWNGTSLTGHKQFHDLMRRARQNQKVKLTIDRQGQPISISVLLGARPGNR